MEFAICALAMMLIVVGFVEFGRLVWTFRGPAGSRRRGCALHGAGRQFRASAGAYISARTTTYVVNLASSRGVVITAAAVSLNNAATCGGAAGFSQVSINYDFTTVAPALVTSLANGFTVPASGLLPESIVEAPLDFSQGAVADCARTWLAEAFGLGRVEQPEVFEQRLTGVLLALANVALTSLVQDALASLQCDEAGSAATLAAFPDRAARAVPNGNLNPQMPARQALCVSFRWR